MKYRKHPFLFFFSPRPCGLGYVKSSHKAKASTAMSPEAMYVVGAVWADWEGFLTVDNGWNYQVMELWFLVQFFFAQIFFCELGTGEFLGFQVPGILNLGRLEKRVHESRKVEQAKPGAVVLFCSVVPAN